MTTLEAPIAGYVGPKCCDPALSPIGADTETERFGTQNVVPELICIQIATYGPTIEEMDTLLAAVADTEVTPDAVIDDLFSEAPMLRVFHNAAYDLAVICARRPELFPRVFEMLVEEECIYDTKVAEKLLNITDTGEIDFEEVGTIKRKIGYSLSDLVLRMYGVDLSAEKKMEDAWRTNYGVLRNQPSATWPKEAVEYALSDSIWALRIREKQMARRQAIIEKCGHDPFEVLSFQVAVDFCLFLMTAWGCRVDPEEKARLDAFVANELRPERLNLLVERGILQPAEPPRPHGRGAKEHVDGCTDRKNCSCPPKMTAGKPEKVSDTTLKAYVEALAAARPTEFKIKKTEPSQRFPEGQVSTDAEWLDTYAHLDPVLEQFQHRQSMQKLVTTDLPRMCLKDDKGNSLGVTSPVVHPNFDILKVTGRTSSFASEGYASFNCQNPHPKARGCIIPRDGYVLFSVDYSQMELGTLAQKCYDLFGYSVLRDQINAGVDVHAYLGAQLCAAMEPAFKEWCIEAGAASAAEVYELFHRMPESAEQEVRDLYDKYRKFAKPTNLGYPGGLGPATFIKYAKATYELVISLEQATMFRDTWRETYPEMVDYFAYINKICLDTANGPKSYTDDDGCEKKRDRYCYDSPFGMHRAGADYCAAANGLGLQTPSAEGAKLAILNAQRACFDPTLGSILYPDDRGVTVKFLMFIHDELVGEVRRDDMTLVTQRVREVQRLMVEAMKLITPDVTPKTEAALMLRWDKRAKSKVDANGNLTIWEPPKE